MKRIEEYQTFGDLWEQHLHPHKAYLPNNQFPCNPIQRDGYLELDAVIHLPNWPERTRLEGRSMSRGQLDILVHAKERFTAAKPYLIQESKITVSYFQTESETSTATPVSTVRYDYDLSILASHPLFHFHCCSECVEVPDANMLGSWRYKIQQSPRKGIYPFRVPTPHMSMCCVLLALVAEHLESEKFRTLWKAIDNRGWHPPPSAKNHLWVRCQGSTAAARPFHNWQWYFWKDD